ncbi:ABC transporter substrate-binding protein [Blastopirellula sp. J2-11]|uniref:CmpA/NrtA family ABC transporter substrate-binding protein n=1 Tax=Blastopirellula sp. J2-11 TaxID=2943192 RepID=UPI0021C91810|nr:CmpA/NrtA family ABC transporter substrate-binding protein [Blastopirellula sp. J2-11]UUO04438.1 ABC transporter substrate-binding protein [Blastopirellula sp. J2-11]
MRRHRISPFAAMFWLACAGMVICGCGQQRSGPSLQDLDIDALAAEATAAMKVLGKEKPSSLGAAKSDRPASLRLEKTKLKFGFIKLTDCAPLVIAKEQGFFADEGLQVEIEAQPNWKTLLERVISGELDGAHMLSGQPIASTIGINGEAHVITAFTMDQNGNAITVANSIWEEMQKADPALQSPQPKHPISADALRPVVAARKASGDLLKMGMVFPVSTHNYELRYWLAASGIHPGMYTSADTTGVTDAEVLLSVTPPPMMPQVMEVGTIQGYCVGEPWNQQAVVKGIGVPVVTNYDIWKNNPEKVFGVTKAWNDENRNTHVAVVKALIQAGKWLDEADAQGKFVNRESAVQLLSKANYVGADVDVIRNSMTGYFYFQKSDKRELPDFNVFFKDHATYPWYSDGVWFLTQMRRWGQITEPKSAAWYDETAKKIYRPDIYREAAERLIREGKLDRSEVPEADTDGYKPPTAEFIDGISYDGHDPIAYLNAHKIGNKDE